MARPTGGCGAHFNLFPMFSFSFVDHSFLPFALPQRLAVARMLGFDSVDIDLSERTNRLRLGQLLAEPRAFIKYVRTQTGQNGLKVANVLMQTGRNAADAPANDPSLLVRARNRKAYLLVLDLCAALGCKSIMGFPGIFHKGRTRSEDLVLATEEAHWRLNTAAEAGMHYAILPHAGSICPDAASVQSLLDAVPGLRITFDLGELASANNGWLEIMPLLPYVSQIRIKSSTPQLLDVAMGRGGAELVCGLRRLRAEQFDGCIAVEFGEVNWSRYSRNGRKPHPDHESEHRRETERETSTT
jgi:sugar phosphate isomerase/epimerase